MHAQLPKPKGKDKTAVHSEFRVSNAEKPNTWFSTAVSERCKENTIKIIFGKEIDEAAIQENVKRCPGKVTCNLQKPTQFKIKKKSNLRYICGIRQSV